MGEGVCAMDPGSKRGDEYIELIMLLCLFRGANSGFILILVVVYGTRPDTFWDSGQVSCGDLTATMSTMKHTCVAIYPKHEVVGGASVCTGGWEGGGVSLRTHFSTTKRLVPVANSGLLWRVAQSCGVYCSKFFLSLLCLDKYWIWEWTFHWLLLQSQ